MSNHQKPDTGIEMSTRVGIMDYERISTRQALHHIQTFFLTINNTAAIMASDIAVHAPEFFAKLLVLLFKDRYKTIVTVRLYNALDRTICNAEVTDTHLA